MTLMLSISGIFQSAVITTLMPNSLCLLLISSTSVMIHIAVHDIIYTYIHHLYIYIHHDTRTLNVLELNIICSQLVLRFDCYA